MTANEARTCQTQQHNINRMTPESRRTQTPSDLYHRLHYSLVWFLATTVVTVRT